MGNTCAAKDGQIATTKRLESKLVGKKGGIFSSLKKAQFPRVFISYRRAHSGWAKALQLELKRLGYPDNHVFFDIDRDSGLEAGPFQKQLEEKLVRADVLLALITDAPSGPKSDWRFQLSSTDTIQQSQKQNKIDYCAIEVSNALTEGTLVVPVYPGKHGSRWIGAQLNLLSGTSCASLQSLNAYPLHDDQFAAGVEVLHRHICNGLLHGTKEQRVADEIKRRKRMSLQTVSLPTKIDLALADADIKPELTLRLISRSKANVYVNAQGYREHQVLEFRESNGEPRYYCIEEEKTRQKCVFGYVYQVCEVRPEVSNPELYMCLPDRRFAMKEIYATKAMNRTPHIDKMQQKELDDKGIVFPPIVSEDVFGELKLLRKLQHQTKYGGTGSSPDGRCHPNIFALATVATDFNGDKVFTFSPLIGKFGKSLLTVILDADAAPGILPPNALDGYFRDARRYFTHLTRALNHCHDRGIAHLDVSLENILVDDRGNAVLIDFGLKREGRSAAAHAAGLVIGREQLKHTHGKLRYIAPEIYRGDMHGIICSKADMWSAAVVLCNLLLSRQLWACPVPQDKLFARLSAPPNWNNITGCVQCVVIAELIPRYGGRVCVCSCVCMYVCACVCIWSCAYLWCAGVDEYTPE